MIAHGLQEFFSDPTQWWDNNCSKKSTRHPDIRCNKPKDSLWYNPACLDSQLAICDAEMRQLAGSVSTTVHRPSGTVGPYEGYLEVGECSKLCEHGQDAEAVDALNLLVQRGCHIPSSLFYRLLKSCIKQKDLVLGRRVHALSVTSGYGSSAFLANHLICMYASHGSLVEAMQVFSKLSAPDAYMWASIILAYARNREPIKAIGLYRQMRESSAKPDNHIYVAVLKACACAGDLATGKDVHAHIRASTGEPDIFVQNCLVDMYAKCGSLQDARKVFDRLPCRDVVTWNAMIAGYSQQGMGQEALSLYTSMQQEGITQATPVTFVCLLQACAGVGVEALHQGKQLHAKIQRLGLHTHLVVGAGLVNMYSKCGSLDNAQRVFEGLSRKDVVTWTTLIAGYAQQGMGQEALNLYRLMQQDGMSAPDAVTFVCLLQSCLSVGVAALQQGKQLHSQIKERGLEADAVVSASLVNMYVKCGSLVDAHRVFDRLSRKDVVTWTAMIAGYAQQGMGQQALTLYSGMQQEGITPPDPVTFVCLLQACASVVALPLGKQLHAKIEEHGWQADVAVGPSLVNMYAKCGSLEDAHRVFESLPERDITAWSALIAGYARRGDSEVVFDLVQRMKQVGIQPSGITFLSVLTVCSHVGLVDKGRNVFKAMSSDFGITPSIEHYSCMVDLLGRAGHLEEALQMVKTMPFEPNGAVWLTLLGACQKWRNVEVGQQAFQFATRLDEKDPAPYILMSNIYAGAKLWEEAQEMQARRLKCGARKEPGRSWWSDIGGVVHSFVVGDRRHPESEDTSLERIVMEVEENLKESYVPHAARRCRS